MKPRIQARPLAEHSWILTSLGVRQGMLSEHEGTYTLLTMQGNHQFDSLDKVQEHLGEKIVFESAHVHTSSNTTVMIDHLPIKHTEAFHIERDTLISYTKQPRSDVRFAAGYWGIKFSNNWAGSLCPKLQTLAEYEHVGPFATKLELNTILAHRNKQLKG